MKKAFKVTDGNMQCHGFQFELGKKYKHEGTLKACKSGFHACEELAACFGYYDFDSKNRVFEIEVGEKFIVDNDKLCAEEITFIKELSWLEVCDQVNMGKG